MMTTKSTTVVPAPGCGRPLVLEEVLEPARGALVAALHGLVGDENPRASPRFPGPNPVSMERSDLPRLASQDYFVCEKTDGVRAAMLCCTLDGKNVCALLDRRLCPFLLPLRAVPTAMFQGSVLDGELAWNKVLKCWQFLVFDAAILSGVPVFHAGLVRRLQAARTALRAYEPQPGDAAVVRVKEFVSVRDADAVRAHLARAAQHFAMDGVVLTPAADGVIFGRHVGLFKLKGGFAEHTVDFLSGDGGELLVYDSGRHVPVARSSRPLPSGGIVECRFVREGVWEPVMVRTDKATANDMLTFRKTLLNIRENLTLDAVLAAACAPSIPPGPPYMGFLAK